MGTEKSDAQKLFCAKCRDRTDVQSECARVSESDRECQMSAISASKARICRTRPSATLPLAQAQVAVCRNARHESVSEKKRSRHVRADVILVFERVFGKCLRVFESVH